MNCTKKTSRIFALLVCMMMLVTLFVPFMPVSAAGNGMDIVLVIDDSGSMENTDPDRLTSVAINKFVDAIPAGADCGLAIAAYSVEIMPGSLSLSQTPDAIKAFANDPAKITQDGAGTDAAMGINWAVSELEAKSSDNRTKAIILIGDGDNSFMVNNVNVRTDAESNAMRDDAIARANAKGIKVYTLAINPVDDEFRKYFEDIAAKTGGKAYEPKTAGDLDTTFKEVFGELYTGSTTGTTTIPPNGKAEITVPDGVFEMNIQCNYKSSPVELMFTAPDGSVYNKGSNNVVFSSEKTYCNYKIKEPVAGPWTITCTSPNNEEIIVDFVLHVDVSVNLAKNQQDVTEKTEVQYIATVMSDGNQISDDSKLESMEANLIITKLDDSGAPVKTKSEKMKVENGRFILDKKISDPGKYEIYAEIKGDKSTIKSNVLAFEVGEVAPLIPLWLLLIIIAAAIIIVVLLVVFITKSRNDPGTGYVYGNVSVKIVGRLANDETMIFPNDKFNCEQIFTKKNTLSDLITAYTKRYRINNSGELAEMTLSQYINSALTEVTDQISICGNKKKQTIIRVPAIAGKEMVLDGMDLNKTRVIKFNSPERVVEVRFKNQGNTYTITMIFSKM